MTQYSHVKNILAVCGRVLLCGAMALVASNAQAALTKDFYTSTSKLASGNWVKIGVEKTGVYEISYQTLAEMGFSDPSKVALYGRGGRGLPESFVNSSGQPAFTDDLSPVKVIHEDGKIYFYGLGPENISFVSDSEYPTGGYFSRISNNIYSKRGYYFLTDSREVSGMEESNLNASSAPAVSKGLGFVYHELDSVQNSTDSGQLFWGEAIGLPGAPRRSWNVNMPDALAGTMGVMQCDIYFPDSGNLSSSTISYGFSNAGMKYFSYPYQPNSALYYKPREPRMAQVQIPGNSGTVFVEIAGQREMCDYSNLDFWVVSYPTSLPSLKGTDGSHLAQQFMAFPEVARGATGKVALPNYPSLVVLDVTNPSEPVRLAVQKDGANAFVGVRNASAAPGIVVFDKDMTQLQISGYEKSYSAVANQNLHGYKDTGADFIIITVPRFKDYAEQIADIHREHDGIEVIVATTEQIFNEFSGGVPDPVAYRSFAKMLYLSDRKPKNLLLFGPLFADFRGIMSEHNPFEGIIAYQSPNISVSRGSYNINDFYGMMDDNIRYDYFERNNVHLGVATLPVKFDTDAKIVVDKIRNYITRTDHAYYLNRYMAVGGIGDQHAHDSQIRDINTHIRKLDNYGTIFSPLAIDTYGNEEAHKKFMNRLSDGLGMFTYFGHGAEMFLGKDGKFFNSGDVYKLRNSVLPFAGFGGCQISNPDRGFRGLGETLVTSTTYGCIGALVSSRETWSGQNMEFFRQFFVSLYTDGKDVSSPHRSEPATIGEIYANLKNYSVTTNELAYQLMCDPALVIPSINRSISVSADVKTGESVSLKPGDSFKMKGYVKDASGNADNSFNGQLVLRLNEPEKQVPAGSVVSGESAGSLVYSYRDEQISMNTTEVKNGSFEIEIHVPMSASVLEGQSGLLYFCAYDPSTRVGAAQCYSIPIEGAKADSPEALDVTPPAVEAFAFDPYNCEISFTVSDNVALNLAQNPLNKGLYLFVDGKERSEAHFAEPIIDPSRPAFSKTVFIDNLAYGNHSARLRVKDAAGNTTETEIVFDYQPGLANYRIVKSDASTLDSTVITTEGPAPSQAVLVVLAANGSEVWRGDFKGSSVQWNHVDASGRKVAPGHYKAYILETGRSTSKGHSATIDIPVI